MRIHLPLSLYGVDSNYYYFEFRQYDFVECLPHQTCPSTASQYEADSCILLTSKFHCVDLDLIMFDFYIILIVTLHSTLNVLALNGNFGKKNKQTNKPCAVAHYNILASIIMSPTNENPYKMLFIFYLFRNDGNISGTLASSNLYKILNDYRECLFVVRCGLFKSFKHTYSHTFIAVLNSVCSCNIILFDFYAFTFDLIDFIACV